MITHAQTACHHVFCLFNLKSIVLSALMAVVCSHLLVHDCVRYTNSSCKINTLTHMADYISVVQVQDGVWPEVQLKMYT